MTETDEQIDARNRQEYLNTRKVIHVIKKEDDDDIKKMRDIAVTENFQLKVEMLKSEYPDFADKLDEEINDPADYEIWKEKLRELHQKRKPKGQARLETKRGKGSSIYEAETHEQLISTIYDQLEEQKYFRDVGSKKFDERKHAELQGMSDRLLESCISGEKLRGQTRGIYAWQCFKCKKTVVNTMTCPHCGYVNRSPSSVRGRVDYVG